MTGLTALLLALALVVAVVDWIAVHRDVRRVELVAKPATLALLVAAALALDPQDPGVRGWFVVALLLSLAGDVFLMFERRFVAGLGAFLVAHLAYIVGMHVEGVELTRFGFGLAVVGLAAAVVGLTILRAVRARSQDEMFNPVAAYMAVISVMVASAAGTGRPLVLAGAGLFYVSDALIAWNRFVAPLASGRLAIMVTYHLAQGALVLSLI